MPSRSHVSLDSGNARRTTRAAESGASIGRGWVGSMESSAEVDDQLRQFMTDLEGTGWSARTSQHSTAAPVCLRIERPSPTPGVMVPHDEDPGAQTLFWQLPVQHCAELVQPWLTGWQAHFFLPRGWSRSSAGSTSGTTHRPSLVPHRLPCRRQASSLAVLAGASMVTPAAAKIDAASALPTIVRRDPDPVSRRMMLSKT